MKRSLLGIALLLSVCGCDFFYGVSRVSQHVSPMPQTACILEALRSIDGISDVTYQLEAGGRPITLHGLEKPDQVHRYLYSYRGLTTGLYFLEAHDGTVEFHQGYGCLNCTPPQKEVDLLYPLMLKIEEVLEVRCNILDLRQTIKEYCSRVRCLGA